MNNPYEQAQSLLEHLGWNSLPVIGEEICKKLDIPYFEYEIIAEGIDGTSCFDSNGERTIIVVNSAIKGFGRKNFTCAHELGHFCMDTLVKEKFECTKNQINLNSRNNDPIELRANNFASELLMPRDLFLNAMCECEPGWGEIKRLSTDCLTSLTATARRIMALTEHCCAFVVSKKPGIISNFTPSRYFDRYLNMESRDLKDGSFALKALEEESIPNDFRLVKADCWISDRKISPENQIMEWSLPLNQYGEVFTVIWDDSGKIFPSDGRTREPDLIWDLPTFH